MVKVQVNIGQTCDNIAAYVRCMYESIRSFRNFYQVFNQLGSTVSRVRHRIQIIMDRYI